MGSGLTLFAKSIIQIVYILQKSFTEPSNLSHFRFEKQLNVELISVAALSSAPHTAKKDFEINGHVIPKGVVVLAITRGLMYDQKVKRINV